LDNILPLKPDLVIAGSLSVERTFRFINTLHITNGSPPVVIISDDQQITDFVCTNGFDDVSVIKESLTPAEIKLTIRSTLETNSTCDNQHDCPLIIGNSPEMLKIKRLVPELNRLNEPALIQGESGTGKDLLARFIHFKSNRNDKPFVKINMPEFFKISVGDALSGAIPSPFHGAAASLDNIFSLAHTGTLLLDEIGAMTAAFQAKLLQLFEKGVVPQSDKDVIDVRLLATTSIELGTLVENGEFRKDLYYRLNVIKIEIPPLRKRPQDIPQLADFYTDKFCLELGKSHYELSEKTKEIFYNYFWPGNVGELEHLVGRIVSQGNEAGLFEKLNLQSEEDFFSFRELAKVKKYLQTSKNLSLKHIANNYLVQVEKRLVKKVLESTNWNKRKAAVLLDISYKSLLNKIKEYELAHS